MVNLSLSECDTHRIVASIEHQQWHYRQRAALVRHASGVLRQTSYYHCINEAWELRLLRRSICDQLPRSAR